MRKPEREFAVVLWDDAIGGGEGRVHEISHRPDRCQTYGWILRDDEHGISIAADWIESTDTYRDITFVPRGMVIETRALVLAKPRRPKSTPSVSSPSSSSSSPHSPSGSSSVPGGST